MNDAAMAASVRAGRVVQAGALPTISDGTAGGIEEGSITLPLCTELVDEWILVEESEICSALPPVPDRYTTSVGRGGSRTGHRGGSEGGSPLRRPGDSDRVTRRQHFLNYARRGNRLRNIQLTIGQAAPMQQVTRIAGLHWPSFSTG